MGIDLDYINETNQWNKNNLPVINSEIGKYNLPL